MIISRDIAVILQKYCSEVFLIVVNLSDKHNGGTIVCNQCSPLEVPYHQFISSIIKFMPNKEHLPFGKFYEQ